MVVEMEMREKKISCKKYNKIKMVVDIEYGFRGRGA
jgi:hypothetical protein